MAVVRPSSTSTSGRARVGKNPCTKALYVSLMSRCDSAAMVPKTSELLPEPETPVKTVSRRFGSSTLTFFRLFTRAPCTRMLAWLSAREAPETRGALGATSRAGRRGVAGSGAERGLFAALPFAALPFAALPFAAAPFVASLAAVRFAADLAADFLVAVLIVSPSWVTGGRRGAA